MELKKKCYEMQEERLECMVLKTKEEIFNGRINRI